MLNGQKKYRSEREEGGTDRLKKRVLEAFFSPPETTLQAPHLLHIFPPIPCSLPPSVLRPLPSSPPAFLSRHAAVPANRHHPGQSEGASRGGAGANKGALLLPRWGIWGGSARCVVRVGGYRRSESVTEEVYR